MEVDLGSHLDYNVIEYLGDAHLRQNKKVFWVFGR